jgi:hypothetical protein
MRDGDPATIRALLDRLLAARARRDGEARFSDAWRTADTEMHEIESAIFRMPPEPPRHRDGRRGTPVASR